MSGIVVVGLVAAVAFVALALQVFSRQLHRLPMDVRRAEPLIDVSSTMTGSVLPAEYLQLRTIVANAILSEASYRTELQPLLDQLGASGVVEPAGRGRSRRSERIDRAVAELERRSSAASGQSKG